jgi:hypothetical protein
VGGWLSKTKETNVVKNLTMVISIDLSSINRFRTGLALVC